MTNIYGVAYYSIIVLFLLRAWNSWINFAHGATRNTFKCIHWSNVAFHTNGKSSPSPSL